MRSQIIGAALVLLLGGATFMAADRLGDSRERPYDVLVVPSPGVAAVAFLGQRILAANVNWLRTVQYLGEPRASERGWDRLLPLAELVTDLDPRHGYAYQVAGVMLSAVDRIAESNAILEKGIRNVPGRYILPYYRAFNAFYYDEDFATAGRFATIAARAPGAPEHVRQNVVAYFVKGDRADLAIEFLREALRESSDPESRRALEGQLRQALLEREAALIDRAAIAYRERHVTAAIAVAQLQADGLLGELPPDPFGGSFYLGADGRTRSTAHEFRYAPRPTRAQMGEAPGVGGGYGGM